MLYFVVSLMILVNDSVQQAPSVQNCIREGRGVFVSSGKKDLRKIFILLLFYFYFIYSKPERFGDLFQIAYSVLGNLTWI